MKKWYSLIDKVYRVENLAQAYKAVKANNGAPGVDRVTVEAYGLNLQEELTQLHHELKTGSYEPKPVLRVEIPKADGSKRPLGIPAVRDRVVQQALLNILQPIFEPEFHPSSYGYRPGRSCHQAVAKAEMFMNKYGLRHVVDMDLSKCFDSLDHELILRGINRKVSDGNIQSRHFASLQNVVTEVYQEPYTRPVRTVLLEEKRRTNLLRRLPTRFFQCPITQYKETIINFGCFAGFKIAV